MSATGIGAAVRRKEDFRFITGQGQYTDDVVRPGETRAVFVRSPHAHAKIKSLDASAAKKNAGRGRRAHRRRSRQRQDRQSDLRLDDPFQGRLADEDGAASGACVRQGELCRRRGRGGDRRDDGARARCRREGEGRLRGSCPRWSIRPRRRPKARRKSMPISPTTRSISGTSATPRRPRRPLPPPSTSPSSTSSIIAWCRMRWSRARRWPNTTPAPTTSHYGIRRRIRTWPAWSSPLSSAWRRSTNCG